MRRSWVKIGVGLAALAVAVGLAATRLSSLQGALPNQGQGRKAPEFTGISAWLNSPPLKLSQLRGKVVWIDFWTYSCINCVRTFPALRAIYARYQQAGLEIVGVHSPEFGFEKVVPNIREAIARYRLPYPVAVDNNMATWSAYLNRSWPHVYLIDATGHIAYDFSGEGGDEDLQTHVRSLLTKAGARTLPPPIDFAAFKFDRNQTPEIYAGYERGAYEGSLGNKEGYNPHRVVDYAAVSASAVKRAGTGGVIFLQGRWDAAPEFVEAAKDGARVELPFLARDVFVVAAPAGRSSRVQLLLDGRSVPSGQLGADAPGGAITVDRDDLYRALHLPRASTHRLTLVVTKGFRLYTFTFG
jgi:thiol-disulfide isomerase/thioredoxin